MQASPFTYVSLGLQLYEWRALKLCTVRRLNRTTTSSADSKARRYCIDVVSMAMRAREYAQYRVKNKI